MAALLLALGVGKGWCDVAQDQRLGPHLALLDGVRMSAPENYNSQHVYRRDRGGCARGHAAPSLAEVPINYNMTRKDGPAMRTFPALLLTPVLMLAAEDRKPDGDHDQLQGSWRLVSWKENGRDLAVDVPKLFRAIDVRWTFDGDTLAQTGNFQGFERKTHLPKETFRLYPEHSPGWIDLRLADGGRVEVRRGIYALGGKKLKVCFNPDGHSRDRPTEFAAGRNSGFLLFEFERAGKAK
jgi:uncharacterized protein (TIGR03067 family)